MVIGLCWALSIGSWASFRTEFGDGLRRELGTLMVGSECISDSFNLDGEDDNDSSDDDDGNNDRNSDGSRINAVLRRWRSQLEEETNSWVIPELGVVDVRHIL